MRAGTSKIKELDNFRHAQAWPTSKREVSQICRRRTAAAARDVSFPGYYEFIEAVRNKCHPEHKRMLEWYGRPYDAEDIALFNLRMRLGNIAKRRHSGKQAYLKSILFSRTQK